MSAAVPSLRPENTVPAGRVGHRLALGVQWLDAATRFPVTGRLVTDLEALGSRALAQRFEPHAQGRHAVRWDGRLAKLFVLAAAEKAASPPATPAADQTNLLLRVFGGVTPSSGRYLSSNDPRRYVPRRLALTPVQTDGVPPSATDNIRTGWLWPGANYPLGANATAIRGRIRRGPSLSAAIPVPWARVVVTRPADISAAPSFATEVQVGWAHGDDRGEFLTVLGAAAVPGGATLPATLPLRLWVFLPSPATADLGDPLAGLPLEQAATDATSDVLRGTRVPAGYVAQAALSFPLSAGEVVRPGRVCVVNDSALLFP
jgi:hypothetical protein